MPQTLSTDYDIDPREYLDRIEPLVKDAHPPTESRSVETVLFADGGPVDYLAWFVLEDYEDHTFFYYDNSPDEEMLRWLLAAMPEEEAWPKFRAILQAKYETVDVIDSALLLEIPDTYRPQFTPQPRANLGFFYSPRDEAIAAGISAVPRTNERQILEDLEKLLPRDDIERFVNEVVEELYDEIEADVERHLIEADIRHTLEADSGFQYETVTTIPDGIHPEFEGSEGELWQKPVSKISYLDGAQGFLKVWLPQAADEAALVTVTSGAYDEETVVEKTRNRLIESIDTSSA